MILLEMKIPQLSMPEATAARNQNTIGDRMEKKPWEKPGSVGGPFPIKCPANEEMQMINHIF